MQDRELRTLTHPPKKAHQPNNDDDVEDDNDFGYDDAVEPKANVEDKLDKRANTYVTKGNKLLMLNVVNNDDK
jgi:hypothetical protein